MDIFDIIVEPPKATLTFTVGNEFISLLIFSVASIITLIIAINHRRFISIYSLNYIATLVKHKMISYKHFAFLLARILNYRHQLANLIKEQPPLKSSKDKHYLWIALIDNLNEARYVKTDSSELTYIKLHKTALEWLRFS